jgi:hypothetical protein
MKRNFPLALRATISLAVTAACFCAGAVRAVAQPAPQQNGQPSRGQNPYAQDYFNPTQESNGAYEKTLRDYFDVRATFRPTVASDGPVLLLTQQLATNAEAELTEDLQIMDRLLRNAVARADTSAGDGPTVMGIRLTAINRGLPLYIEGAGAVFSATVNWPLAPRDGAAPAGRRDGNEKPKTSDSAWERAKRELHGAHMVGAYGKGAAQEPPAFDQAKVDQLIDSIVKTLPEATNVRHVDADEHLFMTVVGLGEGGAAVRLTLKARKSDIDATAKGSMSPAEFRKRVGTRITETAGGVVSHAGKE